MKAKTTEDTKGQRRMKRLRGAVELAVHVSVAQDILDVFARLGEGNGFDELLGIAVLTLAHPVMHAIGTGVVGGECVFKTAELVNHAAEIVGSEAKVCGGREKLLSAEMFELFLFGDALANFRQQLH